MLSIKERSLEQARNDVDQQSATLKEKAGIFDKVIGIHEHMVRNALHTKYIADHYYSRHH